MNEWELFQQAQMGSKAAKEKIVSDNTGLVWSIARRFVNRGYDLEGTVSDRLYRTAQGMRPV